MSKKILVIEDREDFRERLNVATIQSRCVVADVMDLLKDYEEDVIKFEGQIAISLKGFRSIYIPLKEVEIAEILIANNMQTSDEIQVFVVKKEKQ